MSTEASPEVASATPEVATNRKLVKTAWITAETEDFSSLTEGVTSRISQLGGYVENQETYYGSSYRDSGSRRSELVIRIPADQLAAFRLQKSPMSSPLGSLPKTSPSPMQTRRAGKKPWKPSGTGCWS